MSIELGGDITLKGFSDLPGGELVVVKKLVGGYARKISESLKKYEGLVITMKSVHKNKSGEKYELHATAIDGGKQYNAEITDRNLFVALDSVLKKLVAGIK